jgi:enhancing lycopene biosynthesis protein 2
MLDIHGRKKNDFDFEASNLGDSLCLFLESSAHGAIAIKMGAFALTETEGNHQVFFEPHHVTHSVINALRHEENSDQKAEVILAAVATWAMIEDISHDLRASLSSLIEACSSTIDQQYYRGK